ncbi:unnamed protein product, partial [Amoebophrya sp. A25]
PGTQVETVGSKLKHTFGLQLANERRFVLQEQAFLFEKLRNPLIKYTILGSGVDLATQREQCDIGAVVARDRYAYANESEGWWRNSAESRGAFADPNEENPEVVRKLLRTLDQPLDVSDSAPGDASAALAPGAERGSLKVKLTKEQKRMLREKAADINNAGQCVLKPFRTTIPCSELRYRAWSCDSKQQCVDMCDRAGSDPHGYPKCGGFVFNEASKRGRLILPRRTESETHTAADRYVNSCQVFLPAQRKFHLAEGVFTYYRKACGRLPKKISTKANMGPRRGLLSALNVGGSSNADSTGSLARWRDAKGALVGHDG